MFEGSLVESTALLQARNRWPALLSFAAQAVLAVVIVAVPMLHPELLPMHAPTLSLIPPPPARPPQVPPPPQRLRAALAVTDAPTAPSAPPAQPAFVHTLLPVAPSVADTPISSRFGPSMTNNSTAALGIDDSRGNAPHVTSVSSVPTEHPAPVRLSGGVTAGLLLAPIQPIYPAIARAVHQEGTVVVRAIISRTGQIEKAQIISGSPLFQNAALNAVEHARYRPYLLNGQPTEVDTTITISFHLGS